MDVYVSDDTLALTWIGSVGITVDPGDDNHRTIALTDLNAETVLGQENAQWFPELVVAENLEVDPGIDPDSEVKFRILEPELTVTDGRLTRVTFSQRASYQGERNESGSSRPLTVATGDFDGNSVRVGPPNRFSRTDIVHPLVILNAPPTHFDVLDGQVFDISKCATKDDCNFSATFETQTERTVEWTTQLNSDWVIAAEASGSGAIPNLPIVASAKLRASYGERFSKLDRSKTTFTVPQRIDAIVDDWLYAVVVDYDIWEYPILVDGQPEDFLIVVIPKLSARAWFPSKLPSLVANSYLPAHEIGNIFSYQDIASPAENPLLEEEVRWSTGDRVTLNNFSSYDWSLTETGTTQTRIENAARWSVGAEVGFDIQVPFLPSINVSGDYSEETVSTYSSTVVTRKGISVHLDEIDFGVGPTFYSVTPYAYWARNGALVLDYAVKPEISAPGGEPTWWEQHYGAKPDLALILPWRNDLARGVTITPTQALETRSLLFQRVYVEIDPENRIDEVHEDNNLGWRAVGVDQATSVAEGFEPPTLFRLSQNYPNPFNPETVIEYELPQDGFVTLTIFNSLGQQVKSLISGRQAAGSYSLIWDGTDDAGQKVATGLYYYVLQSEQKLEARRMVLVR